MGSCLPEASLSWFWFGGDRREVCAWGGGVLATGRLAVGEAEPAVEQVHFLVRISLDVESEGLRGGWGRKGQGSERKRSEGWTACEEDRGRLGVEKNVV